MTTTQDPTLQSSGNLIALLKLAWNCTSIYGGTVYGMQVGFNSITYGPPNELPPAWTAGNQYSAISSTQVPGFGAMVPQGSGWTRQAGYAGCAQIADMSSNGVVAGKTYAFAVDLQSNWIQLYFLLTGGSSGTTVLPGFGLFNLVKNPNAWTYVTPTQFTGEWQIGLLSPFSDAPVWLSVEYAHPKQYGSTGLQSRLIFTCTGGTMTEGWWSTKDSAAPGFDAEGPVGTQYLHDRSDPYVLCDRNGKPLPSS